MQRILVTEKQFNNLLNVISESNIVTTPTDLTVFLNDNKGAAFISFIKSDDSRVNFKLTNNNGFTIIQNITSGAIYNGFYGDFKPSTMVYGNKVLISYNTKQIKDKTTGKIEHKEGNWRDTITNVVKIELYNQGRSLMDFMELEDTDQPEQIDLPIDDKIIKLNNDLRGLKSKQEFTIIGKQTYKGFVLEKTGSLIEFELVGNKGKVITGELDFNIHKGFAKEGDTISFNALQYRLSNKIGGNLTKTSLSLSDVKNLLIKPIAKTKDELEQERAESERKRKEDAERAAEIEKEKAKDLDRRDSEERKKRAEADKKLGKEVYNIIMNDPALKKVFFKQPMLFGMIKNGEPLGVVAANKVIQKYFNKVAKSTDDLVKKFPLNSTITFEVVGKDMVIPDADNFTLPVGKTYKAIVKQRDSESNYVQLIHKKDDIDPEFFINLYQQNSKEDVEDDLYPAKIKMEYLSSGNQRYTYPPSEMGQINVTNYNFR